MSLREIERWLALSTEVTGLEALDESLVAVYPHLTAEGKTNLMQMWQRRAGMLDRSPLADNAPMPKDNLPTVRWGNAMRALIGAPILPSDDPAAGPDAGRPVSLTPSPALGDVLLPKDNLPTVRWGNPVRLFIGAPILPSDDPAAGTP